MDRICMIVQSLYPQDERVRRQAEALEREGIAVDVICQRDPGQSRKEEFGLVTAWRVSAERPKEGIAEYMMNAAGFGAAAFIELQKLHSSRRYKLIQAHNMPDFLVFCGLIQKLTGKPLILDLHDLSVELFQSKWSGGTKGALLIPLVKAVEKLSCGLADQVMTASVPFRDRLIERGVNPDKITLYFNTADPHIFPYDADRKFVPIPENAKLLYHGTVAERFGLLRAIDAVRLLQKKIPGTTLHVYGKYDPDYKAALEIRIRQTAMDQRVFLEGFRSLEEIVRIIRESDIGLAPYVSDVFTNLIIPTKLLEYGAMAIPIVASRLTGIEAVFDDSCVTFADTESAEDLANKVEFLCLHPEVRRARVQSARKALDAISYDVMSERYVGLVRSLIHPNGTT